jgi:proline dehydrogenase
MMRSFFIYLSKAGWAQRTISGLGLARRAARRFFAGDTPAEAVLAVRQLNERGILATLDHLGENTSTREEATQATGDILVVLDEIERSGVQSNVSIKLSQIGLLLDPELCRANLVKILERAREQNNFVRIDMEDSSLTPVTVEMFEEMHARGLDNCGIVIQSYLYRSDNDIANLVEHGMRVRLVKGAYKEMLFAGSKAAGCPTVSADGRVPPIPAIATHDEKRIEFAERKAAEIGLPKHALEFQMLYGIRRDLQEQLVAKGYPVRVYVPYGEHWYPYYMRRLAERPANVWFIVSNLLKD